MPSQTDQSDYPATENGQPLDAAALATENGRHDRILAGVVVLFSFFVASFPVSVSDVWLNLRTGERIVAGEFSFGTDPFSYTVNEDKSWVHNSWLFDVGVYALYSIAEALADESGRIEAFGALLSLARGLGFALLAYILLKIATPRKSYFPVVASIGLGMLAASERLIFRSEIVSLLFTGLTLFVLTRPARASISGFLSFLQPLYNATAQRLWFLLPPLFALWANLDGYFFLGPVLGVLYLAGQMIQGANSSTGFHEDILAPQERATLLFVLLVATGACLINPYHVFVFQIPGHWWSPALEMFQSQDEHFGGRAGMSPFSGGYFQRDLENAPIFRPFGLTFAEWAFFFLAILGLVSFAMNLSEGRWWRFFWWAVLFGLSIWQSRNWGFFAVAAGPITAMNFQGMMAKTPSLKRRVVLIGQLARITIMFLLFIGLGMIFLRVTPASAGQLPTGFIHSRGGLGWSILQQPSEQLCARRMHQWRSEEKLPGQTFHLSLSQLPNQWAWFSPGLKSFIDGRFPVHSRETVDAFLTIRQGLRSYMISAQGQPGVIRPSAMARWQEIFEKNDISHIVIRSGETLSLQGRDNQGQVQSIRYPLVNLLLQDDQNWAPLGLQDGRIFVLGWKKSPHWAKLRELEWNAGMEAFRDVQQPPPADGPDFGRRESGFARWLSGLGPPQPPARIEARWHFANYQEALNRFRRNLFGQAFPESLRRLVHVPAMALGGIPVPPRSRVDSMPSADVILAIRAARRALADAPHSADTYLLLYQFYEEWTKLEQQVSALTSRMRAFQAMSALHLSVVLRGGASSPRPIYEELARRYFQNGFTDIARDYARLAVADFRSSLLEENFEEERFNLIMDEYQNRRLLPVPLEQLETRVQEAEARYRSLIQLRDLPFERGMEALRMRLAGQARADLEQALQTPELPPQQAAQAFQQLMDLYLNLGYVREARVLLGRTDARDTLGSFRFAQAGAFIAAAEGNYQAALDHWNEMERLVRETSLERAMTGLKLQTLGGNIDPPGSSFLGMNVVQQGVTSAHQRAEFYFHMGLLALEAGMTSDARKHFEMAGVGIAPRSRFLPLSGRYYYLITDQFLSPDE